MAERALYEELVHQLSAVGAVKRELARSLPPDCPPGSAGVLILLNRHGDMRIGRLAELLSVDISVTSRHVAQVAECGWIEREPDPADKRSRILRLTAAGRDVLDGLSARIVELLADRLSDWSDDEVRDLSRLMTRLRDSLDDCRTPSRPTTPSDPSTTPTTVHAPA